MSFFYWCCLHRCVCSAHGEPRHHAELEIQHPTRTGAQLESLVWGRGVRLQHGWVWGYSGITAAFPVNGEQEVGFGFMKSLPHSYIPEVAK